MKTLLSLPAPREVLGEFGIYVHVPFCAHRCFYCDFNAYAGLEDIAPRYMDALARDGADAWSAPEHIPADERPTVTSIFIGGGTPSLVGAESLMGVLDAIREAWTVAPGAEITVECNPESADAVKLEAYLRGGVTRVSFGVQSLDDRRLAWLGRLHDAEVARRALRTAREVGFESVNADLIFGIPEEDDETWERSLDGVLECGVTHVSCYGLTYEEGTPLEAWLRLGKFVPVPEDDAARRWKRACDRLAEAGFARYEISNWALPGEESRHNGLYWACGEYLGIGAGAHSHMAGEGVTTRSWTVKGPERYADAVEGRRRCVQGSEEIELAARASEVMFLGLRRVQGVHLEDFRALTGLCMEDTFGPQIAKGIENGLLNWDRGRLRLTEDGTLLANVAIETFLEPDVEPLEGH